MFSRLTTRKATPKPEPAADEGAGLAQLKASLSEVASALSAEEKAWLDDACYLRFLRARKLVVEDAKTMLEATLKWRREYGVYKLLSKESNHRDALMGEASTGKLYILPEPDKAGRAIMIMVPGLENSSKVEENIRLLVYSLERAAKVAGHNKFTIIIDFATGNFSYRTAPSMSTVKETLNILQNHYPERLGTAILFDAPRFFYALFKAAKPFIDPDTRRKINFVSQATAREDQVCNEMLEWTHVPKAYGGSSDYQFALHTYFE